MTEEQIEEQMEELKLFAAVDAFANAMKDRLTEKVSEGYSGWDDSGKIPNAKLRGKISDDADNMKWEQNNHSVIDIANRCMMLWFREVKK